MLKIIKKICKNWENSKVELKMADEILTAIENAGMKPPFNSGEYFKVWRKDGDSYVWEPEE